MKPLLFQTAALRGETALWCLCCADTSEAQVVLPLFGPALSGLVAFSGSFSLFGYNCLAETGVSRDLTRYQLRQMPLFDCAVTQLSHLYYSPSSW